MLETNHGVGVVEGSLTAGGDMPMDDGLWLMLREKIKNWSRVVERGYNHTTCCGEKQDAS